MAARPERNAICIMAEISSAAIFKMTCCKPNIRHSPSINNDAFESSALR